MKEIKELPAGKKRLLPPAYLFIGILITGVLFFVLPVKNIVPFPWNLIGTLPLLFGIIINLRADKLFKDNNTTVKPLQPSAVLITSGVFRITRNPMYLGFVCILLGIAVITGCLSVFSVPIVFAFMVDRLFICPEEQMLEKQFGNDWHDYKKKTRRWI